MTPDPARDDLTAEQRARDMLERMGVKDAQSFTCGDVVELANLISKSDPARDDLEGRIEELIGKLSREAHTSCGLRDFDNGFKSGHEWSVGSLRRLLAEWRDRWGGKP